ncbi:hypothetical protein JCM3770_003085 [Rhodotorula araucariae]
MEAEEALVIAPEKRTYVEPFVIVASSCSAIAARLCTHPLDTLRIRIQTAGYPVHIPGYSIHGTLSSSDSSAAPASLDSPLAAAPPSPSLDHSILSGIPVTLRYTLCSVTACSIAACVTTPIEVVQARWQTSGAAGKSADRGGIMGIVRELWRQGGPRAFTRGLGIRIAYAIPANGISMTVYESVKRWKGIS